jgi:adenosylhomocysteinase
MDLSFALQALSVEHIAAGEGTLPAGVQPVPDDIDREVARLKLASLGIRLDQLTAEQRRYRRSWE